MSETTLTVVRRYVEGGVPRAEAVAWRWVRGSIDDGTKGDTTDPMMAARARPLPAEFDPGLIPNRWVWIGANDGAAKLPRPDETIRGNLARPDGSVVDTVEHHHHDNSAYWDYYKLPLRAGVELIDEETWRVAVAAQEAEQAKVRAAREAAQAEARSAREGHKAAARAKLAALGLTDDEVTAIVGGS